MKIKIFFTWILLILALFAVGFSAYQSKHGVAGFLLFISAILLHYLLILYGKKGFLPYEGIPGYASVFRTLGDKKK